MNNKLSESLSAQKKAINKIPGMCQLLSKRPDMFSLNVWPAYYSKSEGAKVWDLDNNEYLDMSIAGIGACVLGYADQEVDDAVKSAIANGVASSLNCYEEVELAEKLCDLHPWADMVRYSRSGGEAMAMAVRIARASSGKDVVAFCGYHGWHDWYLAANLGTENALGEHLISGLNPAGVPKGLTGSSYPFCYNKIEELEEIVAKNKGKLGVIVMEPLRSCDPEPGFIEAVRKIADEEGAVLIMDEISAGFRYTTGGAHLVKHKVSPDMAVFSKALGNGYAISAVIGRESVMQAAQKTFISSTNWTERIGPAAALATIRKHKRENVADHLVSMGTQVMQGWKKLGDKYGFDLHVGGMEAMSHFSIEHPDFLSLKALFIQHMLDKGFLASNLCYIMHTHTQEHIDTYLEACDSGFKLIREAMDKGDVTSRLKGNPSVAGFKRLS
ncbi:aminotransferase class III-fold pyridoxal phosphate-dependent enzyme [Maridesulfovibrio sp.]|uniref:aminotransferase class III-fold pyridoxal phosphate-dependent enzyme n=1 Tax=Maridesulfovibrio sp. TaxID=2795000 RepID=UPI0029CA2A83|nr:aminotransferase class III-fold pyridoxal phosphate-dependent enzyme [Maridesulfovibrio sp.]